DREGAGGGTETRREDSPGPSRGRRSGEADGMIESGTFDDAVRDFLKHLEEERRLSPRTLQAYALDLRDFGVFLKSQSAQWDRLAPAQVEAHLSALRRAGLAATSVARHQSTLRTFFHFASGRPGVLDPTADLEAPRRPTRIPRLLTVQE